MHVLHTCDIRHCVNPHHLFIGTQKENVKDMMNKKRNNQAKGSKHHKSKITEPDALKIRELSRQGLTAQELSVKFSLSKSTIWRILNRTYWKHI